MPIEISFSFDPVKYHPLYSSTSSSPTEQNLYSISDSYSSSPVSLPYGTGPVSPWSTPKEENESNRGGDREDGPTESRRINNQPTTKQTRATVLENGKTSIRFIHCRELVLSSCRLRKEGFLLCFRRLGFWRWCCRKLYFRSRGAMPGGAIASKFDGNVLGTYHMFCCRLGWAKRRITKKLSILVPRWRSYARRVGSGRWCNSVIITSQIVTVIIIDIRR